MTSRANTTVRRNGRIFSRAAEVLRAGLLGLVVTACALVSVSGPAFALSLGDAKDQGLVGETVSGYVACPSGCASDEVARLVDSVNLGRKSHYTEIANQEGAPLNYVEQKAGAKLVEGAPSGQWVRDSTGEWKRK